MKTTSSRLLEFYADKIELTLRAHNIESHVVGGLVTPRFIAFELMTLLGQKLADLERRHEEIALALEVQTCRITRQRGRIVIEIPRDDARPVYLLPIIERLQDWPPLSTILGMDDTGHPLLVKLDEPATPHILVAGMTGCGKTELLRTMAISLAIGNRPRDLGLALIGQRLSELADLPHLVGGGVIEGDSDQALGILASLVAEMEARLKVNRQRPRLVAVIDELADLLMTGGAEFATAMTRLTQRGRNTGIHLIAATQKPTAEVLGSLTKANFPVRIVGSVASPEDAKVAAGLAGTGAERLQGKGDFLVIAKSRTIRFQAAYVPPIEMPRALTLSRNGDGVGEQLAEAPTTGFKEWVKSRLRIVDRRGRPEIPPTEDMITYALEAKKRSGDWPNTWRIRQAFGCNDRRAKAALRIAAERNWGNPCDAQSR